MSTATAAAAMFRDAARASRRCTGANRATTKAQARHRQAMNRAMSMLLEADHKAIAGLVTEEDLLFIRIQQARAAGQPRPELEGRARQVRSDIEDLCRAADR